MSGCTHRAQELLPDYVLGRLDPGTMEMVENHLGVCSSCSLEVRLIKKLEDREIPEPGPWFYETLPGKVTAEVEARRRKRKLSLIPVGVGGLMAAALAVLMFLQHGSRVPSQTDIFENDYIQSSSAVSLGLEEEILSASASALDDLDRSIITDLKDTPPDMDVDGNQVLGSEGYETLDVETIRVFEDLIDNASGGRTGGKVML